MCKIKEESLTKFKYHFHFFFVFVFVLFFFCLKPNGADNATTLKGGGVFEYGQDTKPKMLTLQKTSAHIMKEKIKTKTTHNNICTLQLTKSNTVRITTIL